MQTFPNSTERSSDFNSTSNLVLTKTIPRRCLMLSENWQTSSFLWISMIKTCPGDFSKLSMVFDPRSPSSSGQSGQVMAWHSIRDPDQGGTDQSQPSIGPALTNRGRAWHCQHWHDWQSLLARPSLRPARPFYLRLNISNIFSSRLHIFWPTSHWIFSPTNTQRVTRPSSRLNAKVGDVLMQHQAPCLQLTLPPHSMVCTCFGFQVSATMWWLSAECGSGPGVILSGFCPH